MVTGTTTEAINWSEAMTNNIERAHATQECDRPPGLQQQQKQEKQQTEQQ